MRVEVTQVTDWKRVANAARFTVGKAPLDHEPSGDFKKRMCRSEHSPLRLLEFDIKVYSIPYWVAMHLVRHHIGVEKFVTTQRSDRTGVAREELPQNTMVDAQFSVNAQALINISRVRLCRKASKETRKVWEAVIRALHDVEPTLAAFCVPDCIYRGDCREFECCEWVHTNEGFEKGTDYYHLNNFDRQ